MATDGPVSTPAPVAIADAPAPGSKRPTAKVYGAGGGAGIGVAVVVCLHAFNVVHLTPGEYSALTGLLAALGGYLTPSRGS